MIRARLLLRISGRAISCTSGIYAVAGREMTGGLSRNTVYTNNGRGRTGPAGGLQGWAGERHGE